MKLQMMNKKQYFLCLPNSVIRFKGWKQGDNIKVVDDGKGNLLLKKE